MISVRYLNFNGGGFARTLELAEGTTLATFLAVQDDLGTPSDFTIRVNREVATADQVLADGDKITVSPTKVAGA